MGAGKSSSEASNPGPAHPPAVCARSSQIFDRKGLVRESSRKSTPGCLQSPQVFDRKGLVRESSRKSMVDSIKSTIWGDDKVRPSSLGTMTASPCMILATLKTPTTDQYDVFARYHKTGIWRTIACSETFQNFTSVVVLANAFWVGYSAGMTSEIESTLGFFIVENLFLIYFWAECIVIFAACEKKTNLLLDAWFLYDIFLVVTLTLNTWIVFVVSAWQGEGFSAMKTIRVC